MIYRLWAQVVRCDLHYNDLRDYARAARTPQRCEMFDSDRSPKVAFELQLLEM
jgi:hypothetical protein